MALQLDDPNPFRFHWPLASELQINRQAARVHSRGATYKLGANQRDEPLDASRLVLAGRNTVCVLCVYVCVRGCLRPRLQGTRFVNWPLTWLDLFEV